MKDARRTLTWAKRAASALAARNMIAQSFQPDSMMARAERKTGLTDFGDTHFREPFTLLCDELEYSKDFHPLGRWMHQHYVGHFLINRLHITETLKQHPDIISEVIAPPLIIIGLPRTGTTHLMNLLACDDAHRTLSYWEGNHPALSAHRKKWNWDHRRISSALEIATANYLIPELQATHKLRLDGPEECILLLSNSFRSQLFSVEYNTPRYTAWLDQCDHTPAYREHKQQLQILQYAKRRERWLLKAPAHMIGIEGLLKVYPDAMIVQTHRDLNKAIPSICNLCLNTRAVAVTRQYPAQIGEQMLGQLAPAMQRFLDRRDRAPEHQFFDVMYEDIVADPMQVVQNIYDHFGLSFREQAKHTILRELNTNPKGKHGSHHYSMEQFNLNPGKIAERFSPYMQRFQHLAA